VFAIIKKLFKYSIISFYLKKIFSNFNITNTFIHKKVILITSSIYHISKDINIIPSFGLHLIWLGFPLTSQIYLSFFHTPLHYYNLYRRDNNLFKQQLPFGFITSLVLAYNFNLYYKLNIMLGEFWWISPILSHIILTDLFNKDQKHLE